MAQGSYDTNHSDTIKSLVNVSPKYPPYGTFISNSPPFSWKAVIAVAVARRKRLCLSDGHINYAPIIRMEELLLLLLNADLATIALGGKRLLCSGAISHIKLS